MRETLLGRFIDIDETIPDGVIKMNSETWKTIKPIAYRNSVAVKITNELTNESPRT